MRHIRYTPQRAATGRGAWTLLLAGCVAACFLATPGCDSATEPETVSVPFRFLPDGAAATMPLGSHLDFRVEGAGSADATIIWNSQRYGTASGERFRYQADALVDDELRVAITSGDATYDHTWSVDVAPGGRDVLVFTPAAAAPPVFAGLPETFSVTSEWGTPTATWTIDGGDALGGTEFVFTAAGPGPRTLDVAVALGDTVVDRSWSLDVRPLTEALPGTVVALEALPGQVRGEIGLAWGPPATAVFPLGHYEVRLSTTGPVTGATWDGLPLLPIIPHTDATGFTTAVPPHLTGFTGGETIWCGVRCRDERDLLSPVVSVETTVIDGRWWATGTVRDYLGTVLADVDVTADIATPAALTAANGSYGIGPFEMGDTPVISAMTPLGSPEGASWHQALSYPLAPASPGWDFLLLPRYGCDPECTGFDANFVNYFRSLTNTRNPTADRPNTNLYKWASYPVPIHVPDFTSTVGVDYGAACRAMVQAWNDNLGRDFLVLEPDPAAASIVVAYSLDEDGLHGRADLDEPGHGGLVLGEAIPELVTLRLQPELPSELAVQAVVLHEMGHALGLYGHAYCSGPNYLMWVGGINPFERPPAESIHEDEIRAVQLIRDLPQGLEMAAFPTYEP